MERHGLFKVTKPPVVVSSGKMSDDTVVSEACEEDSPQHELVLNRCRNGQFI